jgi:hypothetical protein
MLLDKKLGEEMTLAGTPAALRALVPFMIEKRQAPSRGFYSEL